MADAEKAERRRLLQANPGVAPDRFLSDTIISFPEAG